MAGIQSTSLTPTEYRDFWLAPVVSSSRKTKWGTEAIAFLLTLDTTARRIFSPPQQPSGTPSSDAADSSSSSTGGDTAQQQTVTGDTLQARILSALHFMAMFWEFDASDETFRTVCDRWSTDRQKDSPAQQATLPQELLPALLLGNMSDPFWNFAELCVPENSGKCRAYALPLLRTLLARTSWDISKAAGDITAQASLAQARSTLLPSLLLLRIFVSNTVKDAGKPVQNALEMLQRCVFPGKFGQAVEETLSFLEQEAKAPGKGLRDLLLAENQWLTGGSERPLPLLIVECGNRDAERVAGMATFWKRHSVSRPQLRMSLLATILSRELLLPPLALGLQFIEPKQLSQFLCEAFSALDACAACDTIEEAAQKRREMLSALHSRILATVKLHQQSPLSPGVPRIPPLGFVIHLDEAPKRIEDTPRATPLNLPFSTELRRILADRLSSRTQQPGSAGQPTKIVIVGSDSLLHTAAGTWLCFCKENPRAAETLQAQFYLVPAEDCSFGVELSRVDGWFRLHVLEALAFGKGVAPHFTQGEPLQARSSKSDPNAMLEEEEEEEDSLLAESPFSGRFWPNPPTFVAQVIESYLRDARVRLSLPMTLCQCWNLDGRFEISVPFFSECAIFPHTDPTATTAAASIMRGNRQPFVVALTYHDAPADGVPSIKPSNVHNDSKKVTSLVVHQSWISPYRTEIAVTTPSGGCNFDIADAEISMEDRKPLLCVLDRQAFGPFLKVRITRVPLITFPAMRFLSASD